jgi:CRISPR/Cas system-associated exonuclease Cas4 (RecB family)
MKDLDVQGYDDIVRRVALIPYQGKPGVHPSSFGCFRRVTFELMGTEGIQNVSPEMRELMDTGTAIHRMIQSHYKAGYPLEYPGCTFDDEVKLNAETNERAGVLFIRCSVDGVFTIPKIRPRVLEIKTVGKSEMDSLRKVREKDKAQVNTYLYLLDAQVATMHYVSRANTRNRQLYTYRFDPELWEQTKLNIEMAIEAAFNKSLPPTEADNYTCGICPFQHCCPSKEEWHDA